MSYGDLTARGSDSFSWDYEDRMTSATVGGVTTTFAYRGDGLRHSKTTSGNTTTFTWDVNAGLPVVLDDGNQYVYGAGLEAMVTAGGTYYYLADGLGSTMAMVDTSGTVQKSYTYDVYGKATPTGTLANEFDFAGQETDGSTGLQYLRARYMDAATGTFISRDPMSGSPGWTQDSYQYGEGDPVDTIDPLGLYPTPSGGNATERAWCLDRSANLNFLKRVRMCRTVISLGEYAQNKTVELYGNNDDDGPANAFRHCCWMGLIALNFGGNTARGFGLRHETLLPSEPGYDDPLREVKKAVDLWNNEVGIQVAAELIKKEGWRAMFNRRAVIAACQNAVASGRTILSMIDPRLPQ